MDGKREWFWVILLAPIAAWTWLTGLFRGQKPVEPPPTVSRWTDSMWQSVLNKEEKERWK